MIGLGERRNEAFEIVLKHLDEDRKRIKGRDAVRAIYSGGSLYHIAGPNDATIPLPSAVDRWDKIRVAQERTVAITRADTPSGQQTIIETTLKETEERSSTVSVVYDASTEDRPRPVIAVLEADETGLTTSERQMPKAKNERILESYPDLYERDPRFIERFEAAMAEMLKQFPSLQRDATGAINGKQVAAASNIGIAFILKAIGARYLELDGSRSKPKYKPVGLLTLTYLKHFPDLNFNPASKRQLRDYAGILIDGLVRSQQAANK
jgi:hypothetical protein